MNFLLLLLVLLIEKFSAGRRRIQQDGVWLGLLGRLDGSAAGHSPWSALVLLVLAPVLLVALLSWLLGSIGYGWPALPLALLVLVYALGRGDVLADLGPYRDACRRGDAEAAHLVAARDLGIESDNVESLAMQVQEHLLRHAYQGFFAVIFWFALLGPAVALGYRLLALVAEHGRQPALAERAAQLRHALDWLPSRVLAASFALVGNFAAVNRELLHVLLDWQVPSAHLLLASGRAAAELGDPQLGEAGVADLDALWQLLVRSALLWYAVFALWTLLV